MFVRNDGVPLSVVDDVPSPRLLVLRRQSKMVVLVQGYSGNSSLSTASVAGLMTPSGKQRISEAAPLSAQKYSRSGVASVVEGTQSLDGFAEVMSTLPNETQLLSDPFPYEHSSVPNRVTSWGHLSAATIFIPTVSLHVDKR